MAKLSAHGGIVVKFVRDAKRDNDPLSGFDQGRDTIAIMSDGAIMRKYDARWRITEPDGPGGAWHSWGWKLVRRASQRKQTDKALFAGLIAKGYEAR